MGTPNPPLDIRIPRGELLVLLTAGPVGAFCYRLKLSGNWVQCFRWLHFVQLEDDFASF